MSFSRVQPTCLLARGNIRRVFLSVLDVRGVPNPAKCEKIER